jgi:hypothetical protein
MYGSREKPEMCVRRLTSEARRLRVLATCRDKMADIAGLAILSEQLPLPFLGAVDKNLLNRHAARRRDFCEKAGVFQSCLFRKMNDV